MKICRKCGNPREIGKRCLFCKRNLNARWRRKNPEKNRMASHKYYVTRVREMNANTLLFYGAKQRAKEKGLSFDIEKKDIVIPAFCPVLGIPLKSNFGGRGGNDFSPSLDRIFPELGYVKGNIVVISKKANAIKSNATAEEIEKVANWVKQWNRDTNNGADISPAKY
jgi:hypothetical protein